MPVTKDHVANFLTPLRSASQAAVSPDGARVAYTVDGTDATTMQPVGALWIVDIDGGNARQLLDVQVVSPQWMPDGASIVYGHEKALTTLDIATGETRTIATHDADIAQIALSPDGTTIAFVARIDPHAGETLPGGLEPVRVITRWDYKQDGVGLPNDAFQHIFLAEIATGAVSRLSTEEVDHVSPRWSPDGRFLAVQSDVRTVFTQAVTIFDTREGTQLTYGDARTSASSFAWLPDAVSLIAWRTTLDPVHIAIARLDVETGAWRELPNPDAACGALAADTFAVLDEATVAIAGLRAGRSGLWLLDLLGGTVTRHSETDDLRGRIVARATGVVVQEWSGPQGSGELLTIDPRRGTETRLTTLNDAHYARHRVGRIEQRSVRNEGIDVSYLIKVPWDFDETKRYPVVFEIHGGPNYLRGHAIEASNQMFLDAGYLGVCPNPRGSISWGDAYMAGVIGDWGGGDWRDDLAVVDAIAALPYTDESRFGIYGYSYGGYLAAWAIGQTDRFRAAVAGACVSDLVSCDGTVDTSMGAPAWEWGGEMPALRDLLIERSPITWAHRATTPTLVIHGEADQRCAIGQGEQLFVVLQRMGVPSAFVRYPGQFHGFPWGGPMPYRIDYHWRVVDWFQRYLSCANVTCHTNVWLRSGVAIR